MSNAKGVRSVLLSLIFLLLVLPGCSPRYADPYEEQESIERPARAIGEEENSGEKAGKIIVVVLAVGAALGAIVAPLLIFLL